MKKPLLLLLSLFIFSFTQAQQPFITTWEVTTGDLEIIIPTSANVSVYDYTYDYTVDFGDGTVLNNQTGDATHTYTTPGIYTVSITGDFPHFCSLCIYNQQNPNHSLKSVDQWGDNQWLNMEGAFFFCKDVVINASDTPDLSQVSIMRSMFSYAEAINQNINSWDVSNITNMEAMFSRAKNFNQPLDNWDVSNVTYMNSMFTGAQDFNQSLSNWDVSNVQSMDSMFADALSFNQPLNNWDVSGVLFMDRMFSSAFNFNQPLDNWNVSNVVDMSGMFQNCDNFNQSLQSWNVSNVINMSKMFFLNDNYNLSLNNWDVSNVINMSEMFHKASSFNQPLSNWDVSSVVDMSEMFHEASNFNQSLDSWDVSNVEDMSEMFHEASSFDQPLSNWDVSSVEQSGFQAMFRFATAFDQDISNWEYSTGLLNSIFDYSGMSRENYDLLINKLVLLNIENGFLGAENIEYCDAFARQQLSNAGWYIDDEGLASDCNLNYVSGFVRYDSENNGCNFNDHNLSNCLVNVNNGQENAGFQISYSGQFIIPLDSGNYTLSLLDLNPNFTSTPPSQTLNFTGQSETLENINFCVTANQQFEDLAIDIFPLDDAIPGFETDYQIIVSNNGTQTVSNYQVTFVYNDNFQSFGSSSETTTGNTTNLLTFDLIDIDPFSQKVFEITMLNAVPPTLNGGEILSFSSQVTPVDNDTNPDDNVAELRQTVVNSYDPNDKMVVQGSQIVDEDIDQYLDYRIRFQNLGTANALNVKITDTIDNNLDWTTFQPITSSHDYRIEIVDGEQINYYFDNINLPFETADPEGSNGYITYKIKPKPSVQIGDTFENTAYIYFDFNLPIVTNTVVTTVVDNLDVNTFDFSGIDIYPNPVKDKLNISLPNNLQLHSIELFDIQGKRIKLFENQFELDFSAIQQGIYILRLGTNQGVYNHKVVKA